MNILDNLRNAMETGGNLGVTFTQELNTKAPGMIQVYLHQVDANTVRIDLQPQGGEEASILWLPWRQGELPVLQPFSIDTVPVGTLFFTYELTGCKVFAIQGGPAWHIDSEVRVDEFWPRIMSEEWVEDHWPVNTTQNVAYIHRAGQAAGLWDLSAHLNGAAPQTYGHNNVGNAVVGGIVRQSSNSKQLELYYKASPWAKFSYAAQKLK
ncbi:MAG TPA: BLF1 family deaminating toxin [Chitinophaga sp.]|uniref:BLF1 family deaminating toxin n=1 Tax=Chitinophaga sp. TaxID=1869181 RepID=UPI002BEDF3CC|nr:BLF1 family deaminating toxin [Chitinophaga sp.]HVI45116.1 BLF1 family deaminating toxin [Chitinophaga sp.]